MFSVGGKKREADTKTNPEWDSFDFNVPTLEGEEEISENFEDADLNDPDLLKELQALSTLGAPKAKPKSKTKPETVKNYLEGLDLEALQKVGEEEVQVELTEEDLNDPNLLKELSAFGVQDEVDSGPQTLAPSKEEDVASKAMEVDVSSVHTEKNSTEQNESIYGQLQPKEATSVVHTPDSSNYEENHQTAITSSPSLTGAAQPDPSTNPVGLLEPIEPTSLADIQSDVPENVELLKQRIHEFKQAALFYKRQNDLPTARSMLAMSKSLQQPLDILLLGGQLDDTFEIPTAPVLTSPTTTKSPDSNSPKPLKTVKSSPAKRDPKKDSKKNNQVHGVTESFDLREVIEDPIVSQIISKSHEEQYSELIGQLEEQISLCTSIAAHYYRSGDKSSALQFHKSKKNFLADLASLRSYQEHQRPVPSFHYQDITYVVENAFYDIPVNEMEFEIVRGFHLGVKEVSGNNVDAYVSFDLGWPTEGSGPGKGDTSVIRKSMDPEFQFTRRIPIERTRSFQRFIERKKAVFEVFHYRGFLWRAVSLGKIQVKLDRLLSRCEIHEVMELLDTNRRPTGGKLEIKIRLRNPLLKADILTKSEKWLFLEFDSPQKASSSVPGPVQSPVVIEEPSKVKIPITQSAETDIKRDIPLSSTSAKSKQPQQKKSHVQSSVVEPEEPDELQLAIEEFNSADKLVSNMVLEQELQLVQGRISQLPQPTEELLDRQQALEIKMNMLVIQVQTGKLTMIGYLNQVKEAIKQTKRLTLIFKNHQKMELAKHALARIKTMSQEVQEAENAMAEGLLE